MSIFCNPTYSLFLCFFLKPNIYRKSCSPKMEILVHVPITILEQMLQETEISFLGLT